MTCWNGDIRVTGDLIAQGKTRWFLFEFFWDGMDWVYHTKYTMRGDITLPDKDGVLYTVTIDKPSSTHTYLGVTAALTSDQEAEYIVLIDEAELFTS